jgi:hypothetical protein
MDMMPLQGKTNLFEKRVGEHAKSGVGVPKHRVFSLDEEFQSKSAPYLCFFYPTCNLFEVTYPPDDLYVYPGSIEKLKLLVKTFRSALTTVLGCLTFSWRFNTPDVLACYPGSTEKL